MKLGNIDVENILERFESGDTFLDLFLLLFQLLEVIQENPQSSEVYHIATLEETAKSIVVEAEETRKKILKGEKITTTLSTLISDTDTKLEDGLLSEMLDDTTHFFGDEVHFQHGETDMA